MTQIDKKVNKKEGKIIPVAVELAHIRYLAALMVLEDDVILRGSLSDSISDDLKVVEEAYEASRS